MSFLKLTTGDYLLLTDGSSKIILTSRYLGAIIDPTIESITAVRTFTSATVARAFVSITAAKTFVSQTITRVMESITTDRDIEEK